MTVKFPLPLLALLALAFGQCKPSVSSEQKKPSEAVAAMLTTHKEAADTLLLDSMAPLKNLIIKNVSLNEAKKLMATAHIDSLLINDFPRNGFYGEDRYRIEMLISSVKKDANDPFLFHIEGKNRYKKVITPMSGTIRIRKLASFTDPNLNKEDLAAMNVGMAYTAAGTFEISETGDKAVSGVFKGDFNIDFYTSTDVNYPGTFLWYYSQAEGLATKGSGYRFDGTWTAFSDGRVKPIIWAEDIFRFSNDILKDFSIGERDVTINPKYRHLGWDDFWENDEWWTEAKKPSM